MFQLSTKAVKTNKSKKALSFKEVEQLKNNKRGVKWERTTNKREQWESVEA